MAAISPNDRSSSINIQRGPFPGCFPQDIVLDIIEHCSLLFPVGVFQFVCKEWHELMHHIPIVRQSLAIEWAVKEAQEEKDPLLRAGLYLIILRKAAQFSKTRALQIFDESKTIYTHVNDKQKQLDIYWQFFEIRALLDESGTFNTIDKLEDNIKARALLFLAKQYPGKGYLEQAEKQIETLGDFDSKIEMLTDIKLLHHFRQYYQDIARSFENIDYVLDSRMCSLVIDQSKETLPKNTREEVLEMALAIKNDVLQSMALAFLAKAWAQFDIPRSIEIALKCTENSPKNVALFDILKKVIQLKQLHAYKEKLLELLDDPYHLALANLRCALENDHSEYKRQIAHQTLDNAPSLYPNFNVNKVNYFRLVFEVCRVLLSVDSMESMHVYDQHLHPLLQKYRLNFDAMFKEGQKNINIYFAENFLGVDKIQFFVEGYLMCDRQADAIELAFSHENLSLRGEMAILKVIESVSKTAPSQARALIKTLTDKKIKISAILSQV